jgi:methionine-rich copper-binding protein CopC
MLKTLAFVAAFGLAGPAFAQDGAHANHAGHAQHGAASKSAVVTIPADGAMLHGAPQAFTATFPHAMTLRSLTVAAKGQAPASVTVTQASPATQVSVALPRLAPGDYTATWTAQGADGHEMTGVVRFMVH